MPWTINGTDLDLRSISRPQLFLQSLTADELTLDFARDCDSPVFAAGTWIELRDPDGTKVFAGEVLVTSGQGDGNGEANILRALGPWKDLEEPFRDYAGSDVRLRFPEDLDSTAAVPVGDAVRVVLERAISLGARFEIGTINIAGDVPSCAFDNTTAAAIITALLRYSPGATAWFDYSIEPYPRLHVVQADSLPVLEISVEDRFRALSVTPRTDLRVPGVRLIYRKRIISSYGEAEATSLESAGSWSDRRGLVMAFDLNPAQAQYQLLTQRLIVEEIDVESGDWWRRFGVTSPGDPTSWASLGDETLTHYLAAGALVSWMVSESEGVPNEEDYGCSGPFPTSPGVAPNPSQALTETAPALHIDNSQSFRVARRKFTATFNAGSVEAPLERRWMLDLICTDCTTSGAYYREALTGWDPGESVPAGLASDLYTALQRLASSGSITLDQAECTPAVHHPGLGLNILGTAWSGMRAPVQTVVHALDDGATSLVFGPPTHLGAADLLEVFRATHQKKPVVYSPPEDEIPEPVEYLAVAAVATQDTAGEDPVENGTLNITIDWPSSSSLTSDAFGWVVNEKSGSGSDSIELPPGVYTITFLPVLGYNNPLPLEVTIVEGGTTFVTGEYKYAEEIYLEKDGEPGKWVLVSVAGERPKVIIHDDNDGDPIELAIDLADVATIAPPEGFGQLKLRRLSAPHMGLPGYRIVACSESYPTA